MSKRKKRTPQWWPGIYEGRTPDEVLAVVGTAPCSIPVGSTTPKSMRAPNPKTFALRLDGKLAGPLNGR